MEGDSVVFVSGGTGKRIMNRFRVKSFEGERIVKYFRVRVVCFFGGGFSISGSIIL